MVTCLWAVIALPRLDRVVARSIPRSSRGRAMTPESQPVENAPPERPSNLPALPNGRSDVLIAGGGFAGFALAIALRQALGANFTVTLTDPAVGQTGRDVRASAIAAAPRRMVEAHGVCDAVADEAQPILDIVITDSPVPYAPRPV